MSNKDEEANNKEETKVMSSSPPQTTATTTTSTSATPLTNGYKEVTTTTKTPSTPLTTMAATAARKESIDTTEKLEIDMSEINNNIKQHLSPENLLLRTSSPPSGGPCAGKTTSINKIKSFFDNIGWKVLVVPETAYTLLSSGVYFYELNHESRLKFQENLLKTLLQIENTINETAKYYSSERRTNCLVIYDRGAMDPVSYVDPDDWEQMKLKNPDWNEIDLRDNRYDQVVHLVTAANGAEQFYTLANNCTRTETIEVARELDERCSKAWCGHPCMDVVDNCYYFERKVSKALQVVCERIGLKLKGFDSGNRKRKFLVKYLPDDEKFPNFKELNVVHNYLVSNLDSVQVRLRKSGQGGNWAYSYATRIKEGDQLVDTRTQIDLREYAMLQKTIDRTHWTVYVKRRCFIWRHRYYRIDIYEEPCEPRCRGLILLFTRWNDDEELLLPDFIPIEREVTNELNYSMFNLSKKATPPPTTTTTTTKITTTTKSASTNTPSMINGHAATTSSSSSP